MRRHSCVYNSQNALFCTPTSIAIVVVVVCLLLNALPVSAQTKTPFIAPATAPVTVAVPDAAKGDGASFERLSFLKHPLRFEPNVGQPVPGLRDSAKFMSRQNGYTVQLDEYGAEFAVASHGTAASTKGGGVGSVRMNLLGAVPHPAISGEDKLPGIVSYFPGNDRSAWRTAIPTYGRVAYKEVYRGIDAAFYGNDGRLEYDFLVGPGANASDIKLSFAGADAVRLDDAGNLVLSAGSREFRLLKPVAYQENGGARTNVAASYELSTSSALVSLNLGAYDRGRRLVIDPVLVFATYTDASKGGGENNAVIANGGVKVDSSGNIYIAGNGVYDSAGFYVAKYSSTGSELFDVQFGSAVSEVGVFGLAVDSNDRPVVTGLAASGFPTTSGAYQATNPYSDGPSAFLSVLSATGASLAYSTYLGGGSSTGAFGLALDTSNNAYIYGQTNASTFPTTTGAYLTAFPSSYSPYFVAKINPTLSGTASLVYSTFFWNTGSDPASTVIDAMAVDPSGNTYLTGTGSGLATTSGAYSYPNADGGDAGIFVSKLNAAGSALTYTAYLGPGSFPLGADAHIAVDSSGTTYVAGVAGVDDFPTTSGAWQTSYPGAFVANLNAAGSALVYSTFLGGPSCADNFTSCVEPAAITIEPGCSSACAAFVTGFTYAVDFPQVSAIQSYTGSSPEVFATELNGTGAGAVYSTYFGGTNGNALNSPSIAADSSGNTYLASNQSTSDAPATLAAPTSSSYGFLAKIGTASTGETVPVPLNATFLFSQPVNVSSTLVGDPVTVELRNMSSAAVTLTEPFGNSNPQEFSESDNCSGAVAAGSKCTLTLNFTPAASGARTGTLTISSNAGNSPVSLPMTGYGYNAPYLTLSASSFTFADTAVGSVSTAKVFTITNIGDEPALESYFTGSGDLADFTQENDCPYSLGPGLSCTFSITFSPTQIGYRTVQFVFFSNGASTPALSLAGTGTESGVTGTVTLSTSAENFGTQTVGYSSGYGYVYITNTGAVTVTLSSVVASTTTSGAGANDFAIAYDSCTPPMQLNPQQSCYVEVVFTPSLSSAEAGTLKFTDDATGSPQSVALSGVGTAVTQVLEFEPGNLVFSNQGVGSPSPAQTFYAYNQGDAPFTVYRTGITGDFQVVSDLCSGQTLSPPPAPGVQGGNCSVEVTFTPSTTGARTGTMSLVDAAGGSPQTLSLMGTGITPAGAIVLDPTAYNFGSQIKGTTSNDQAFTISNTGNILVNVTSLSTTGNYAVDASAGGCGAPPFTIAVNSSCQAYLNFTPSTTGALTGTLVVDSSAGNQTATLTGTGVAATAAGGLTSTTLSFGNTSEGNTNYLTAYVRNTGTETITFTGGAITGTDGTDYSLSDDCGFTSGSSLAPGTSCGFQVGFTPATTGTLTGSLAITSNAATLTLALTGVGYSGTPTTVLLPYNLNFTQATVGTSTTTADLSNGNTVTIIYNGTSSITLKASTIASGSANYSIVSGSDTCNGATLTQGSSCTVQVQFNPSAAGYLAGTLDFNNATSGSYAVALAGYAPADVDSAYVDPTAIAFNPQALHSDSSTQQIVLSYAGNATLTMGTLTGVNTIIGTTTTGDFTTAAAAGGSDSCSGQVLTPASTCSVVVAFAPGTTGARTGSITFPVTYHDGTTASPEVTLAGSGIAVEDSAVLEPSNVSFTDQALGSTSSNDQQVQLFNGGDLPLTVGTLTGVNTTIGGTGTTDFNVPSGYDGCSGQVVSPNNTCSFYVFFAPMTAGARTGSITAPVTFGDGTKANFTASLSGKGVASATTVAVFPTTLSFGSEVLGQGVKVSYQVTVADSGNKNVTVGTTAITGTNSAQFKIVSDGCSGQTLVPGSSCSYTVGFAPTAAAAYTATLSIPDNASGSPQSVSLAGTGVAAASQVVLSQASVAFGNGAVGTAGPAKLVYVINQGNTTVTVTKLSLGGTDPADFLQSSNCSQIPANSSCQISLQFQPAATGSLTATLTEVDNVGTHTVSLSGTGVAASTTTSALYPTSLAFGSTGLATTATGSFSFTAQPESACFSGFYSGIVVGGASWLLASVSDLVSSPDCYAYLYALKQNVILIGDTVAHTVSNVVAAVNGGAQTACGYLDPNSSDSGYNTCYQTSIQQPYVTATAASPAVNLKATAAGALGNCAGTCSFDNGWSSLAVAQGAGDVENMSPASGGLSGGVGGSELIFSVQNTSLFGGGSFSITKVMPNSSAYQIANDGCTGHTLSPGQNCEVSVVCAPTALGTANSTITVTDSLGTLSETVDCTGVATKTTTNLASSANPVGEGQAVTFTANVVGFSPTGKINFTSNGTSISGCSAVTVSAGAAACATSFSATGTYSIVAAYSGDSKNDSSTSATLLQMVNSSAHAGTVSLTSFPNPSTGGQPVTLTARVGVLSAPGLTGTVVFKANGTLIGSAALSSGVATLTYAGLTAGQSSITATYEGSYIDAAAVSLPVSQVVSLEPTTSLLAVSESGEMVTQTCAVNAGNGSAPRGAVAFLSGDVFLGTAVVNSSGAATFSHAFNPGTYSLTCKYAGAPRWGASTSPGVTVTVN